MKVLKELKIKWPAIITILFLSVLFIVLTFFDEQLSKPFIDNHENFYTIFFSGFGNQVTPMIGAFAGSYLIFSPRRKDKYWNVFLRILATMFLIAAFYLGFSASEEYCDPRYFSFAKDYQKPLQLVLLAGLIIVYATIIVCSIKFTKNLEQEKLYFVCLAIVAIVVGYSAITEVVKYFFSRPRPRLIYGVIDNPNNEVFKYWFQIRPAYAIKAGDGYKSFPSGHAWNAGCVAFLIPLFLRGIGKDTQRNQTIGFWVGFAFALAVAVSRFMASAHFATDVIGGVLLGEVSSLLLIKFTDLLYRKWKFLQ